MREYEDFELEVGQGRDGQYPLAVLRSPSGEVRATLQADCEALAQQGKVPTLREAGGARAYGQLLFNTLFCGGIGDCYTASQTLAESQGKGLRIKLRILDAALSAIPWEFMNDPRFDTYLALSSATPIVRYLELPRPVKPLRITPPLRVLGLAVSPSDLPPLNSPAEIQHIEDAVRELRDRGLLELTWLEGHTWRDLQNALRENTWHAFHFIGHGLYSPNAREGALCLANDQGTRADLSASQLGRLLADHPSMRLAIINACEGARGDTENLFSSLASTLVRQGLPAVLAMQAKIVDRAAIEFSRTFYASLADGFAVDSCTSEARKAMNMAVPNNPQWGIPVLYMRSPNGQLFETVVDTPPPPASFQAPKAGIAQVARGNEVRGVGFFVSVSGLLVTTQHAVDTPGDIKVIHQSTVLPATLIHQDPDANLALLQVQGQEFPAFPVPPELSVALFSEVYLVGRDPHLGMTVKKGLVDGMEAVDARYPFSPLIPVSAEVPRGFGGAPVFTVAGKVAGMVVLMWTTDGQSVNRVYVLPAASLTKFIQAGTSHLT